MKDHKVLYGSYKKGSLDDAGIEELNRLLVEVYFSDKGKLDREEMEYTEDLIFELYAKNELEEANALKFSTLIEKDKSLKRRFSILKSLVNPEKAGRDSRRRLAVESEKADEQEEEELKSVLQEVLAKAHAEEEASSSQAWLDKLVGNLKNFFQNLMIPFIEFQPQNEQQLSPVYILRPQVKVALAFASLSGLALIVWFSVSHKPDILVADNSLNDTVTGQQIPVIDSGNIQIAPAVHELNDPGSLLEENYAMNDWQEPEEKLKFKEIEMPQLAQKNEVEKQNMTAENDELLASLYEPPGFTYELARGGEIPDATERLARASYFYNGDYGPKDYDSCIFILEELLNINAFKDQDTLNMVRYYLGNSYLKEGMDSDSKAKIEKALLAFKTIDPQNEYYLPSKWFSALAYMKLGNSEESFRLCDSLANVNYNRMGNVEVLRDSLYKKIGH
jgi:hypothetical protein